MADVPCVYACVIWPVRVCVDLTTVLLTTTSPLQRPHDPVLLFLFCISVLYEVFEYHSLKGNWGKKFLIHTQKHRWEMAGETDKTTRLVFPTIYQAVQPRTFEMSE